MKRLFVFCASLMMIFDTYAQCQIGVFDSMLFIDKPDMTQYGLTPIKLIGGSKLFPIGTDKSLVPADKTVINAAWFKMPRSRVTLHGRHSAIRL
jgi:hypothetical protein